MWSFYNNLSPEDVQTLDRLSRLLIELRESRLVLLQRYGVENASELAEKIRKGEVPEHPAYEDYVGVKVIEDTRELIRSDLRDYMLEI